MTTLDSTATHSHKFLKTFLPSWTSSRTREYPGASIKKTCHTRDIKVFHGSIRKLVPMTMFASTSEFQSTVFLHFSLTRYSPAILYNSVVNSPDRLAKIKNTTLFQEDLKANKLPQWMFISEYSKTISGVNLNISSAKYD